MYVQTGCALMIRVRIVPILVVQYKMFDGSGYLPMTDRPAAAAADETLVRLLRRCATRDASALRMLYDTMSPTMMGVALRLLRDRPQAEETLQEAFLQIWHNASQFDPLRGSARAWIISILRYRALDRLATESKHRSGGELPDVPDELSVSREDSHALAGCIAKLPEHWRRSVILSYVEGYSHSEIAGIIETPLGTVKSWIVRSLDALKKCLDQ